jgi:Mucin-2 protein WxxW repeating region
MRKPDIVKIILLILICLTFPALVPALETVKSAIGPGDISPIKKPFDQVQFETYIGTCKTELEFDNIPQFDCRDVNFILPGQPFPTDGLSPDFSQSNDFVAHNRINNSVDAVFACRWVDKTLRDGKSYIGAVSGEMIVHNRFSGKTCFFQLKEEDPNRDGRNTGHVVTTNPISPTDSRGHEFWENPSKIETCTNCHIAGPYIASPSIVKALAKFGLINDGHDTFGVRYTAVGSLANKFNPLIKKHKQPTSSFLNRCSEKCHAVGGNSEDFTVGDFGNAIILPSIHLVIDESILKAHMPPNDRFSDYRWINRDSPADAGDYERLSAVETEFNEIYESCNTPEYMQAHEVDNTLMMQTNDFVDVIDTFNLHDGLICLNVDQTSGRCNSYETRYRCNGKWTSWQSNESPSGTGDNENRSRYKFPASCTSPYAIQARYYVGNTAHIVNGPPDRLYQFDKNALVCRNKDQPAGESCHNYTVRFICP